MNDNDFLAEDEKQDPRLVEAVEDLQAGGGLNWLVTELLALSAEASMYDPDDIRDDEGEPTIDCRLRYSDGCWSLSTGQACYVTDWSGYWGSACVGVDLTEEEARGIARALVDQVLESISEAED